jgi:hypothetical protein
VGVRIKEAFRAQLEIDHRGGGTRVRVEPAGLFWIRLVNTFVIAPKVRRALRTAFGV